MNDRTAPKRDCRQPHRSVFKFSQCSRPVSPFGRQYWHGMNNINAIAVNFALGLLFCVRKMHESAGVKRLSIKERDLSDLERRRPAVANVSRPLVQSAMSQGQ